MAGPSSLQPSPALVSAMQWTLAGVELLVLGGIVAWLGRSWRFGWLARPFRRRSTVGVESAEVMAGAPAARLVAGGGSLADSAHDSDERRVAMRTPLRTARVQRGARLTHTPARGTELVAARGAPAPGPATLHCPGCGTLLARGDGAIRLVTRCTGCDRRVAIRHDGSRIVVTLES